MPVRARIHRGGGSWPPDPYERKEQKCSTEQPRPHEDAQHDEDEAHTHPQPRASPPRPSDRARVAGRGRDIGLDETTLCPHAPHGGSLPEDDDEAEPEDEGNHEGQHEEDGVGETHRQHVYSGTCDSTMMRGSVISSIAKRRPSRPKPESFDPP